ncbi:hypothetical protein D3C78_1823210 [compost metagenome]
MFSELEMVLLRLFKSSRRLLLSTHSWWTRAFSMAIEAWAARLMTSSRSLGPKLSLMLWRST